MMVSSDALKNDNAYAIKTHLINNNKKYLMAAKLMIKFTIASLLIGSQSDKTMNLRKIGEMIDEAAAKCSVHHHAWNL